MDNRNQEPSQNRQPPTPPTGSGRTSKGSGTGSQGLFSITCTTCQARLVVRSASAIGTILECPRCASMVQVTPPPDWTPEEPTSAAALTSGGPPPLDHVAAAPVGLELEPPAPSRWFWPAVWTVVLLVTLGVAFLLLQLAPARPRSEPVATPDKTSIAEKPPVETPTKPAEPKKEIPEEKSKETPEKETPQETKPKSEPAAAAKSQAVPPTLQEAPKEKPEEAKKEAPKETTQETPKKAAAETPPATNGKTTDIKKKPPEAIDFAARLNDPVAGVQWSNVPLRQAVDWLSALGAMPISIDLDALQSLGVGLDDPVSVDLQSTTLGKALGAIASQRGLAIDVESNRVVLGAPLDYRNALRTVRYNVSDLTGDDKRAAAQLAETVQRLVAPDSWQSAGGRGAIAVEPGWLAITQTGENQARVLAFCERLRLARGKPLRSPLPHERFTLTTHRDQAQTVLSRPITGNFHEPTPLAKLLGYLARAAQCDIVVDHAALATAETSDGVPCSIVIEKQPLSDVLDQLLPPLGLVYRAGGPKTLQITTQEAADQQAELEFHPITAWLDVGTTADDVIRRLKTGVAAATWTDAGGSADVCFDPASQCLIVLQSQPVQAEIERQLKSPPKKK
ncbi:MAG: hypothetical protein ABFC77_05620 [Thermoguttaceae bacterium]